jgi:hypothetical protein
VWIIRERIRHNRKKSLRTGIPRKNCFLMTYSESETYIAVAGVAGMLIISKYVLPYLNQVFSRLFHLIGFCESRTKTVLYKILSGTQQVPAS